MRDTARYPAGITPSVNGPLMCTRGRRECRGRWKIELFGGNLSETVSNIEPMIEVGKDAMEEEHRPPT